MKVVINACFGGFGLSVEGVRAYAAKKGLTIYPEPDPRFPTLLTTYWLVPPEERVKELENWGAQPVKARQQYNEIYCKQTLSERNFDRADPVLVAVVEELGSAADGRCAKLKVVEIPDDIEWEIAEYDGYEHVAQKHGTWH